MTSWLNLLVGVTMGLNLLALGGTRPSSVIRAMALQGAILGVLPLLMEHALDWRVALLGVATVASKGLVMPALLRRAARASTEERDVDAPLGPVASLLLGAAVTVAANIVTPSMPLRPEHAATLLVPGAVATMLSGLLLLIGRTRAVSQVCGYLILENGIYLFGLLLIESMPLLVEAGVLLDVTAGVFVIGILVDRIQRAFDSLDTRRLTTLRG